MHRETTELRLEVERNSGPARRPRTCEASEPRTPRTSRGGGRMDDDASPRPSSVRTTAGALGAAGLLAAILMMNGGGGGSASGSAGEVDHPNWSHVESATRAGGGSMRHLTAAGGVAMTQAIVLDDRDRDPETTRALADAVIAGDTSRATEILRSAQEISPPAVHDLEVAAEIESLRQEPSITAGLAEAVVAGDVDFFHIHLYDSCDEDGDVVEILINGSPFAVVPITHAGATLSVPLPRGSASTLAIRGIRDGGGGITVACRTSAGDYFSRVMGTGEIQPLGLLRP